ncbi:MAG: sigma factor-like helix-turn-helix DNA-binding protein [Cyanobacteria bacterium J06642_2]
MDFLKLPSFFSFRDRILDRRNELLKADKEVAERMLLNVDSQTKILDIALEYMINKHHLCRGDAGICSHQDTWYRPCSSYISVNSASHIDQGHIKIPNFLEPQISVWKTNQPIHFPEIRISEKISPDVYEQMKSAGTQSMTVSKIECFGQKIGTFCLDSTHADFIWQPGILADIHRFNGAILSKVLWYSIHFSKTIASDNALDFMLQLSPAEKEMLSLLTHEFSVKQTAKALNVSVGTIRKRILNCRKRFNMTKLVELKAEFKRAQFIKHPNSFDEHLSYH